MLLERLIEIAKICMLWHNNQGHCVTVYITSSMHIECMSFLYSLTVNIVKLTRTQSFLPYLSQSVRLKVSQLVSQLICNILTPGLWRSVSRSCDHRPLSSSDCQLLSWFFVMCSMIVCSISETLMMVKPRNC